MESESDITSIPNISDESVGSSVSSRLQEEYESLLKYALVTPAATFTKGAGEDNYQSEDQIRLLRSSNPNPTPLPAADSKHSRLPSRSSSGCDEPNNMYKTYEMPSKQQQHDIKERSAAQKQISDKSSTPSTFKTSLNTTEGEKAKEVSIQNRVFGSLPMLHSSDQCSNYTLDELDASVEERESVTGHPAPVLEEESLQGTHDSDIVRLENQIAQWNVALRQNILAELTQIKLKLLQQQKSRIIDEREKSNQRMARLTMQNEELKELVANCERTIAQKDSIIANLTTSLNKQKSKEGLMKSFNSWKLRHCDEKREDFCCQIASEYHTRRLVSRAFRAWQSMQENKWKERVERACQNRAQEVCEELTRDYEGKIAGLQRQLGHAHTEIGGLRADREQFEERMKKGFMRGVCALNLEAMTMFKEEDAAKENVEPAELSVVQPLQSIPVQSEHPLSNMTTTSYPPSRPSSKQVFVKLTAASNNTLPSKQQTKQPCEVIIERHSGPTHHAPVRVPPRKHKHKPQMAVKIVE